MRPLQESSQRYFGAASRFRKARTPYRKTRAAARVKSFENECHRHRSTSRAGVRAARAAVVRFDQMANAPAIICCLRSNNTSETTISKASARRARRNRFRRRGQAQNHLIASAPRRVESRQVAESRTNSSLFGRMVLSPGEISNLHVRVDFMS